MFAEGMMSRDRPDQQSLSAERLQADVTSSFDDTTFVFMKRHRSHVTGAEVIAPTYSYSSPKQATPSDPGKKQGLPGIWRSGSKIAPQPWDILQPEDTCVSDAVVQTMGGKRSSLTKPSDDIKAFVASGPCTVSGEAQHANWHNPPGYTPSVAKDWSSTVPPRRTIHKETITCRDDDDLQLESMDGEGSNECIKDLRSTYVLESITDEGKVTKHHNTLSNDVLTRLPIGASKIETRQPIGFLSSGAYQIEANVTGDVTANQAINSLAPLEFICPLSGVIMRSPVKANDGYTYERTAIYEWLRSDKKSPMTTVTIVKEQLKQDLLLRSRIQQWMIQQQGRQHKITSELRKIASSKLCDIQD